jgi:uncharacterized protein
MCVKKTVFFHPENRVFGAVGGCKKPGRCSGFSLQFPPLPRGHFRCNPAALQLLTVFQQAGNTAKPRPIRYLETGTHLFYNWHYFYAMVTNLEAIAAAATANEPENDAFADFLRLQDEVVVDSMVTALNEITEPAIDCTACGNCCKTLMINVSEAEAGELSAFLKQPLTAVKEQYLERGLGNQYIINRMPCTFLTGTVCSIYNHRFAGCREFPALTQKHFTQRLFTVFMHYGRCPIIFNVVEALKIKTGFKAAPNR